MIAIPGAGGAPDELRRPSAMEAVMRISESTVRDLIAAVAKRVIEHADELTALDQAIGDGDHGINMKRGFEAVLSDIESLVSKPLPEAVKAIGTLLVMTVGGASGPLYGTLFMTLGKQLPEDPDRAALARAFGAAIQAVKARGKSNIGAKTMLDVLAPVLETVEHAVDDLAALVRARAAAAAESTIPMKATRGRASFLGDRSIGHMDPGARSSFLMIGAVCDVLENLQ